jgi:hypothetical protein
LKCNRVLNNSLVFHLWNMRIVRTAQLREKVSLFGGLECKCPSLCAIKWNTLLRILLKCLYISLKKASRNLWLNFLTVFGMKVLYTYIHTYVHAYIHTYIHTHTYIHPYIHIYLLACIYTYIHKHTYIHIYIHTYLLAYLHTYLRLQVNKVIKLVNKPIINF